jgi:hypothetical protein
MVILSYWFILICYFLSLQLPELLKEEGFFLFRDEGEGREDVAKVVFVEAVEEGYEGVELRSVTMRP